MNKPGAFDHIAEYYGEITNGIEYSHDLIIVAFIAIINLLIIILSQDIVIRTVVDIPILLFCPGYALIAALLPKKRSLEGIERIALSFGLSIALASLLALGLNYTAQEPNPLLTILDMLILAMCILAYWRRLKLPAEERCSPIHISINIQKTAKQIYEPQKTGARRRIEAILTTVLLLSLIASVFLLIYIAVTPKIGEKFTEFYILGKNGKAADYPTELKNHENGTVIIGVVNHEYEPANYTLEIRLEGDLLINDKILLEHNKTYERIYQIMPNKNGTNMKLEFLLFREGNSTPYRNLYLWINVE